MTKKTKTPKRLELHEIREDKLSTEFKGVGFLLMCVYLCMITTGMLWAFLSVFAVSVDTRTLWIAAMITSIATALLWKSALWRRWVFILPVVAVSYGYGIYYYREAIIAGYWSVVSAVYQVTNNNYQVMLSVDETLQGTTFQNTVFFLAVMFLVLQILGYGLICRFSRSITGLVLAFPVLLALFVGEVPAFGAMVLLLLCFLAVLGGHGRQKGMPDNIQVKNSLYTVVIGAVILAVTAVTLYPLANMTYNRHEDTVQEFHTFVNEEIWPVLEKTGAGFSFRSNSDIGDGRLDRQNGFTFSGTSEVVITTQDLPTHNIYVRGFVGNEYAGDYWEAVDEDQFIQYARERGWHTENVARSLANTAYTIADTVGTGWSREKETIIVRRTGASGNYTYIPYVAYLPETYEIEGDGGVRGTSERESEFEYYPLDSSWELTYGSYSVNDDLGANYDDYVYQNYLSYPAEGLERLEQQCRDTQITTIDEAVTYVIDTLQANTTYDLETPSTPEGRELAEYFLYESHRGYCIHYATTATLMFRMMGIPARYVTGYVAQSNNFFENEDGTYTADVRDDRSHAWVEIYTDAGWLPIETTPPYLVGSSNPDQTTKPEEVAQDEVEVTLEETPTPTPEESEDTSEENGQDEADASQAESEEAANPKAPINWWAVLRWAAIILLVAFVLTLILMRVINYWRRRRIMWGPDSNQNIRGIFRNLYDALVFAGFPKEISGADKEFVPELMKRHPQIRKEELKNFMKLVILANYGDADYTQDDVLVCRVFYRRMCSVICKKLPVWKRLLFWIYKGF